MSNVENMDTENEAQENEAHEGNGNGNGKRARQAVDAPRRNYFMMDPNELIVVGHDTKDGPENALFDPRVKLPMDESLVRNIQVYGVLEPILAVKDGEKTMVVAGRRRVLHAREAAKRQEKAGEVVLKVPVIFKRGEDQYLFGVARTENAGRVADGPMTNARNAQRMLDMGASEDEIAIAFQVKKQTVKDWLVLLGLAPKVKTAVEKGTLSASAAASLGKLPKEEQEKHLDELLAQGAKPTVDTVINKVRASKGKAPVNTPKMRIEKAEGLLMKAVPELNKYTKDELIELVDKLSKAIVSKGIAKLQAEIEKEAAAEEAE